MAQLDGADSPIGFPPNTRMSLRENALGQWHTIASTKDLMFWRDEKGGGYSSRPNKRTAGRETTRGSQS